ncbi:nucleoplasmin-like protein isoform X3 [Zootermopsis nevadensis]|uniref:nucleoplasmin-like protein isoform X3 n=1 Tax=Zootermopsis nevadensis TaxID=136037 RepID=UPI000B8E9DBA|nr:nucleoplasmin-like protein isoform X3 [Zootermopsis nevadensis]
MNIRRRLSASEGLRSVALDLWFCKGITLSSTSQRGSWELDLNREALSKNQYLTLRQVFLGQGAKEGEENIVQVEVTGRKGKRVMPIVCLRRGSLECCNPNISFSDMPILFTLLKGSGPVHLYGNHVYDSHKIDKSDSDEEDDCEEDENVDDADDEEEEDVRNESPTDVRISTYIFYGLCAKGLQRFRKFRPLRLRNKRPEIVQRFRKKKKKKKKKRRRRRRRWWKSQRKGRNLLKKRKINLRHLNGKSRNCYVSVPFDYMTDMLW